MRTLLAILLALFPLTAHATDVQTLARIRGQGESVLRGVGLVVGLPGTGDSGKELATSRPLAELLKNNGAPVGSLKELAGSKAVALVSVTCTISAAGALPDDRIDVSVSVLNSAKSLKGGKLYLTPLLGPRVGSDVYAFAEGTIDVEDDLMPTTGRVRGGARIVKSTREMLVEGETFDLILEPYFAGWTSATRVASSIDDQYRTDPQAQQASIAMALDDRVIRVSIPKAELANRAVFVADVLSTPVNISLLGLAPQVVCNQRSGAIVVTGDVEISPGIITHKDLVISTTVPPPVPTPQDPLVTRSRWAQVGTDGPLSTSQTARLADLLNAFKQLDIPVPDQVAILQMLAKGGRLRAKLIVD